jgi:hypothetical protein
MGRSYYIYEEFTITGEYRCLTIVAIHFLSVKNNFSYIHGYCTKLKMTKDGWLSLSCEEDETLIQNFLRKLYGIGNLGDLGLCWKTVLQRNLRKQCVKVWLKPSGS